MRNVMPFASAILAMERGHKIRRSHWTGYWCLEHGEVIIHCKEGRILNLRDTEDMIYTLKNIASNDWEIVSE